MSQLGLCSADDLKIAIPAPGLQGQQIDAPSVAHAGRSTKTLQHRLNESAGGSEAVVLCVGQRKPRRDNILHVQSRINRLNVREGAHQQPGADQQHHRKCHLDGDQRLAKQFLAASADGSGGAHGF